MARGRQRIRTRGSRQQWAQARSLKAFGADDGAKVDGPVDAAPRPLPVREVVASSRCGLCGLVLEQRLRDGETVVLAPHALCISCDDLRCQVCWDAADDACADGAEHEFMEVRYGAAGGEPLVADFVDWTPAAGS